MDNLVILGSGRENSSLDSYSYEFSEASGFYRIMLLLDRNQLNSNYRGNPAVYKGKFPKYAGAGWAYNIKFGRHVFKDLEKLVGNSVIHYTTFGLPILSSNPRDIVTIHDLFFLNENDESYRKNFNVSKKFVERFKKFNNIVAPSYYVKKELENFGFNGDISVIYIPVPDEIQHLKDKAGLRKKLNLPENKKLVLSVSSNLKRKNLPVIEKTMELLGNDFRLVRVGPPIRDSINFNSLSSEELSEVYNACDVLLFPTLMEGFGKPVIEAFKAGTPVVASNIEVMEEVAGDAALLVNPDARSCARGIKDVLDDYEFFIKKGFERAEFYSKEKFRNNVRQYYGAVLKK